MTTFDESKHRRDDGGKFSAHVGAEQDGSLVEQSFDYDKALDHEHEQYGDQLTDEDAPWTWTALTEEVGRDKAAELYERSNGSLGKALAMANDHEPRPVTNLTKLEANTMRKLTTPQLKKAVERFKTGPGVGFRETGPEQRAEILRQITTGNVLAISGGRAIPLPDGVELPVSNGYSVRTRLAGNDTYTVQRVFSRGGTETVKGELTDVYAEDVGETAYQASCFHDGPFGVEPGRESFFPPNADQLEPPF